MSIFRYLCTSLFLIFIAPSLFAQQSKMREIRVKLYHLPPNTPETAALYLAGNVNGWNPADPRFRFARDAEGILSLDLSLPSDNPDLRFKITRGSWQTVEKDRLGGERADRQVSTASAQDTFALKVERWADLPEASTSTQVGRVLVFPAQPMPQLNRTWTVRVYLPPRYDSSAERYPSLYMYDGQNLFDRALAAFGSEWQVDESLEELFYEERSKGLIVVAIDNTRQRGCDYNVFSADPHPFCADGRADGPAINDFIATTLKPWVDQTFRTRSEREFTTVMGSSMGGQMALDLGLRYPDVFSKVFALSPSYQNRKSSPVLMPEFVRQHPLDQALFFYQDIGTAETIRELQSDDLGKNVRKVAEAWSELGYPQSWQETKFIANALHNEDAWAARFKELAARLNP